MLNTHILLRWREFVAGMNIDSLFANQALQRRAWELYKEDVCTFISINDRYIIAQIQGRTNEYRAGVAFSGCRLEFQCSCPSRYYPCKHIGALLYTLRDTVAKAAGHDCFSAKNGLGHTGTVSADARYRPAFLLAQIPELYDVGESVLGIEPVLVYQRKHGGDGRIQKFNLHTPRMYGNETTEELLYTWESGGAQPIRAIRLCTYWYQCLHQQGKTEFELPVELYLERCGRLEREKRAMPRRIVHISIRWLPEEEDARGTEYRATISLADKHGHSETYSRKNCPVEHNDDFLLVANAMTGTLWYLSHLDFHSMYFGKMGDIAALFDLERCANRAEIATLRKRCGRYLNDIVVAHKAPSKVVMLNIPPIAVIDIGPERSSSAKHPFTILKVHFCYRFGNQDYIRPCDEQGGPDAVISDRTPLIPISTDMDTAWCIARNQTAEANRIHQFCAALKAQFQPDQFVDWEDFPDRLIIEATPYEVVLLIAGGLLSQGFEVRLKRKKVRRPPGKAAVRISASGEEWLDLEPGFDVGGRFVPIEHINARGIAVAEGDLFMLPPGADTEALLSALQKERIGRKDFSAMDEMSGIVSNPDHPAVVDFLSLRKKLESFSNLQQAEVPDSLHAELRSYQKSGLSWLWFLHSYQLGGCLADDMGLGKTVQTLALLAKAREVKQMQRALVVCPVSTLGNWQREVQSFTPHFSVCIHAGAHRARSCASLEPFDIILVGYATMRRDVEMFRDLQLDYLILDEAQAIKNPKTKRRKAAVSIRAAHRLALTGTPIENSTVELWSLFDFLMPGILGSRTKFIDTYGSDIEFESMLGRPEKGSPNCGSSANALRRLIRPLLLRRTKAAVAPELPQRKELLLYAEAGRRQARVYESLREKYAKEVDDLLACGKGYIAAIKILEAMLRLRQAAILPSLVDPDFASVAGAKIDLLYDRLLELREEGNKALVFSQFTGVLDEVCLRLSKIGMQMFRLDGSTPQKKRDRQIAEFQREESAAVFLISLKAGGLGINLTAADYVFILDPWWNPAVEDQAIDRAHRIGREGVVIAYRIITKGTIEEKIIRLQEKKRRIADSLIKGESGSLRKLTNEDIKELFKAAV